jgi:hypothetical protein
MTEGRIARSAIVCSVPAAMLALAACSPEARRVRDGGEGADPGNKRVAESPRVDPGPADTTLWPGRAPTPVERLAAGQRPPPAYPAPAGAPGGTPVTPDAAPTPAEQRSFDRGRGTDPRSADPRRPSGPGGR